MRQVNPQAHYLITAIENASSARRVVMLYDGAIRFLSQAIPAMQEQNYEVQSHSIGCAQEIISFLMSSLDREVAGKLGQALDAVYVPLFDMLTDANVNDKMDRVQYVIEVLRDLREAWVEVDRLGQIEKTSRLESRELIAA